MVSGLVALFFFAVRAFLFFFQFFFFNFASCVFASLDRAKLLSDFAVGVVYPIPQCATTLGTVARRRRRRVADATCLPAICEYSGLSTCH